MRRLFLRCDASKDMGTGHFFRMVALGEAARQRGVRPELVCSVAPEKLLAQVEHAGLPTVRLTPEPGSLSDADAVSARAESVGGAVGVVVDGYHFPPDYYQRLDDVADVIGAVDDVGEQPFPVDVLVNVNPHAPGIEYDVPEGCVCLLGPEFAFLRRQFRTVRRQMDERGCPAVPSVASDLLISLGGGDPTNETGKALQALGLAEFCGVIDVVVGPANPHREELEDIAVSLDASVRIHSDVTDMAGMMRGRHLAVSAAGGTSWELACLGVPMLQVVIADNQVPIAEDLASRGVSVLAGTRQDVTVERLATLVGSLVRDRERRARMANRGRSLVDGRGALRVIDALNERADAATGWPSTRSGKRHG